MTDPLPAVLVQWSATDLTPSQFLRYEVWRRLTGTSAYTKLARITDPSQTGYTDFTAIDGVEYDYSATQVEDVSGQEVSSAMATAAQVTLNIQNLFVHDYYSPGYYVELWPQMLQGDAGQDILYVQPRNQDDPVAHVGRVLTQKMTWRCVVPKTDTTMWPGLLTLQQRQHDDGSVLFMRAANGMGMICTIDTLTRDFGQYNPNLFTIFLTLQRTYLDTTV